MKSTDKNAITKHMIKKFEERLLKNIYDTAYNIKNVKQQNCQFCKKIIFTDAWIPICSECGRDFIK